MMTHLENVKIGRNEWWRYLLTILTTVGAFLAGQIPVGIYLYARKTKLQISDTDFARLIGNGDLNALDVNINLFLVLVMIQFAMGLITLVLMIRFVHRKPLLTVLTARSRFDFSRFTWGFLLWFVLATGLIFVLLPEESYQFQFELSSFLILLVIAIVFVPIQTLMEELFFRGYLMQGISLLCKYKIVSVFVTAILFTVVHTANPEFQHGFWKIVPVYFLFALVWGLIVYFDDGLELSWGIHTANNLFTAVILSTSDGAMNTASIYQTTVSELMRILPVLLTILSVFTFVTLYLRYQWDFRKKRNRE